jgi:16S rRNA (uracil1498-N3)-methyltransferase
MGRAHDEEAVSGVPRFHVPEAAPGARLPLPEHTAHHARDVLRLRAGDEVRIFDGRGSEFDAVLEEVSRHQVNARLSGPVAALPESALHIVLALPPLKGDRMELVIQKATELGAASVWPVVTTRTDAAGRPALQGSRQERWEKVASGAAEQCGRATVPEIAPTATLDTLIARPFEGARVVLVEDGSGAAPATWPRAAAVLLLIGPAGGWDKHEVERLVAAGFVRARLGPRILRAETAAIAALAAVQVLAGDLGA